jgi:hypothetical protein
MAKRGEISADKGERTYRYSARPEDVEAVRARVEALGISWHDAVEAAGVSRNVGYTLLRGKGSIGSLRTIEAWVSGKEDEKAAEQSGDPRERWATLGAELEGLGPEQLEATMEALQEYVSAERRRRAALSKILRVTPKTP